MDLGKDICAFSITQAHLWGGGDKFPGWKGRRLNPSLSVTIWPGCQVALMVHYWFLLWRAKILSSRLMQWLLKNQFVGKLGTLLYPWSLGWVSEECFGRIPLMFHQMLLLTLPEVSQCWWTAPSQGHRERGGHNTKPLSPPPCNTHTHPQRERLLVCKTARTIDSKDLLIVAASTEDGILDCEGKPFLFLWDSWKVSFKRVRPPMVPRQLGTLGWAPNRSSRMTKGHR